MCPRSRPPSSASYSPRWSSRARSTSTSCGRRSARRPKPEKKLKNLTDVGKERIRRVIARLQSEEAEKIPFESPPHIRPWVPDANRDPDAYAEKLLLYNDPLAPGWKPENVLWEVALREGFGLNTRFEKKALAGAAGSGNVICEVTDPDSGQQLVVCLDERIRADLSRHYDLTDRLFVCRDQALDDTAAANLALQCRLKTI